MIIMGHVYVLRTSIPPTVKSASQNTLAPPVINVWPLPYSAHPVIDLIVNLFFVDCDANITCAGNGWCNASGLCACRPEFTGDACDTCSPNLHGPNCVICTYHSLTIYLRGSSHYYILYSISLSHVISLYLLSVYSSVTSYIFLNELSTSFRF